MIPDVMKRYIRDVRDFPEPGVVFKDITPLLEQKFHRVILGMAEMVKDIDFQLVAGIDARGFILGGGLASHFFKGFVPVRKGGKLPGQVVRYPYGSEYDDGFLEVQKSDSPGARVLLVDDVYATGGSIRAASRALRDAGYVVAGSACLINLKHLNGKDAPPRALITYEG